MTTTNQNTMKGFFITGTDTGVGKTLIGGAVAGALARQGKNVGVMKPIESGCRLHNNRLIPEDALFLKQMAKCPDDIEIICPYCFKLPLAPVVAALIEKKKIKVAKIKSVCRQMQEKYDLVLVEGAGGLMVPVTDNYFMLDIIKSLNLPLIIVSRLCLGTINHTLLTVKQAIQSGIAIAGIIFNQMSQETGKAEETNPDIIKRFSAVPILGQMPFIQEGRRRDAEHLAGLAESFIDLAVFSP